MENLPRDFRTDDLGEAAALQVTGLALTRIFWEGSRAYFIFTDATVDDLLSRYRRDQLSVPAHAYYQTLRKLRDQLFNQKGGDTHEHHHQA